ncbi:MAG: hypothetical protein ACQEQU_01860 [Spirochaetota bacterium]
MKRLLRLLIFVALALAALSSCTIRQEIYIEADDSGAVEIDVTVEEFFNEVVEDFTVFAEDEDSDITEMNIEEVQNSLNESPYTRYADIVEIEENHYIGTFQFIDAERFFNDFDDELKLESLFTFEKEEDTTTLSMYLDLETYGELTELIPLLKDESFATFGPEENEGVSQEDYLDMISYLLGEEGPDAVMRSEITLIINTNTPIKDHEGGEVIEENRIRFTLPMIDFLLLAEPVSYSVTW